MTETTLENWRSIEVSATSFRRVGDLIPTARIAAVDCSEPDAGPVLKVNLHDIVQPTRSHASFDEFLDQSYTDALVVMSGSEVVFEWYASDVNPDDLHIVFSVSKSVTGLLAGVLADRGELDLEGRVTAYIPEAIGSVWEGTTVRNLLDMTAAIDFSEDYSLQDDRMLRYRQAAGWVPGGSSLGLRDFLLTLQAGGEHGTAHQYLSPVTDMLGWVCERAAGMTFAAALEHHLWRPGGFGKDAEITVDPRGAARAAGGLCVTPRDMARLGRLVLDPENTVLSRPFIEDLFIGGSRQQWADGDMVEFFPGGAYRNSWYVIDAGEDRIGAFGIHGQMIYVDRELDIVVAKQSHWPDAVWADGDRDAVDAAAAIARTVSSRHSPTPTSVNEQDGPSR